jgi:hypothetical protein
MTPEQTELTPEQETILDQVFADYDSLIPIGETTIDNPVIVKWLKIVYESEAKIPMPPIEIAVSPQAACRRASELTGERVTTTDDLGIGNSGWLSRYDAYHRLGVLTESDDEVAEFCAFVRTVWDTILLDGLAIVIRRPVTLLRDPDGNLHCPNGPAVAWIDGVEHYAWHGVWVGKRLLMSPETFTRDEYQALPAEQRRALGESWGWDRVTELLGAVVADEIEGYALLRAPDGAQWLRMRSPELQDGSRPWYVEPVHEDCRTAAGARRWRVPPFVDPKECDADPTLEFEHES